MSLVVVFFKVYRLVSPYEDSKSIIKHVLELASRVNELSSRLRDLEVLASRIEAIVKPQAQ